MVPPPGELLWVYALVSQGFISAPFGELLPSQNSLPIYKDRTIAFWLLTLVRMLIYFWENTNISYLYNKKFSASGRFAPDSQHIPPMSAISHPNIYCVWMKPCSYRLCLAEYDHPLIMSFVIHKTGSIHNVLNNVVRGGSNHGHI